MFGSHGSHVRDELKRKAPTQIKIGICWFELQCGWLIEIHKKIRISHKCACVFCISYDKENKLKLVLIVPSCILVRKYAEMFSSKKEIE